MFGKANCTETKISHPSAGSRIKLKAPCPVEGCPNSNSIITWKCDVSDHYIYIYDDGFLGCEDRSTGFYGRIDKWRFNCGEHDFQYPSFPGLANMVSILSNIVVDGVFSRNLIRALSKFADNLK